MEDEDNEPSEWDTVNYRRYTTRRLKGELRSEQPGLPPVSSPPSINAANMDNCRAALRSEPANRPSFINEQQRQNTYPSQRFRTTYPTTTGYSTTTEHLVPRPHGRWSRFKRPKASSSSDFVRGGAEFCVARVRLIGEMFVYAEYEHSFDTAVVEHTRVRNSESERFEPKHVNDFDRMKTYYVRSCRRDSRKCAYEGAKIIHMTGTLEEMAMFRAKRPRRAGVGREDFDEDVHDTRPPLCKDREHIREEERQQQIDDALNSYKLERASMSAITDLQQRLLSVEKELERLRQEGKRKRPLEAVSYSDSVPKNVHVDLVEQYKKIQTDFRILKSNNEQLMKRLEDRNRAILEADERILESSYSASDVRHRTPSPQRNVAVLESSATSPPPCDDESIDDQDLGSSPSELGSQCRQDLGQRTSIGSSRHDGKVYAGCGIWIKREYWDMLMKSPTDSLFCRSASLIYWTREQMKYRSVTGVLSEQIQITWNERGKACPDPPRS
ncbi:hypothetical protein MTO96_022974 [Rhipicephalus appendiculatus]